MDPRYWIYTSSFLIMLAVFLTMVSLYFIYRMIGKNKSWYILLGAPWLHRLLSCGSSMWTMTLSGCTNSSTFIWPAESRTPMRRFIQLFIQHFLGTGFFEETVKALPIFALVIAGRYMTPEMRAKIGVEEPLDGILIGAASGGGFAIMETLSSMFRRTW